MSQHSSNLLWFVDGMTIPKWNVFSKHLVTGCMDLAQEYLADEGFLVSMCLAEHIGDLIVDAARVGLVLHRTWTLFCESKAYRHPVTREAVWLINFIFFGLLELIVIA